MTNPASGGIVLDINSCGTPTIVLFVNAILDIKRNNKQSVRAPHFVKKQEKD